MTIIPPSLEGKLVRLEEILSRNAESIFWLAFILVPMFSGLLAYDWLPHESYNPETDRLIASHEVTVGDKTGEVYDAWQNKKTGAVYRIENFERHRRAESGRMAYTWFMYGLVGCAFYAFRQYKFAEKKFTVAFAQALAVDIVVALYTYFDLEATNDRIIR